AAEAVYAGGGGLRAGDGRRADPVSVLRCDFWDDCGDGRGAGVGESVRDDQHAQHVSAAGGGVFGGAGRLYSFGREQVDCGGAIRTASGESAPGASWVGGADL